MLPSNVLILGRGRLGRSLYDALGAAGIDAELSSARTSLDPPLLTGRDLIILAVPDDEVGPMASRLPRGITGPAGGVVHLSGALGLEEMSPARDQGYEIGSLHPLRPFATPLPPAAFNGVTIAVDASGDALLTMLSDLARRLGARPRLVVPSERATYHAAAILASTYIVVLAQHAVRVLNSIGWDPDTALTSLLPLMRGTLENLTVEGLPGALTGPVRRGDTQTIAAHIRAIAANGELAPTLDIYRRLGLDAVAMARRLGLSDLAAARTAALLQTSDQPQQSEREQTGNDDDSH